jgi:carbonic anhydrase/acetyltransferase-like protein (isoleucine patch superfamily)
MDGARIGTGSLVAAGALVPEGVQIPPKSLVAGIPGKVRREITDDEHERILANARTYRQLMVRHAGAQA